MNKKLMAIYLAVSAIGFTYLVTPEFSGIGAVVFVIIQFGFLYKILPNKKPLWLFVPIFVLALNSFISANTMWRGSNFFVIFALYAAMGLMLSGNFRLKGIFANMIEPFKSAPLPLEWLAEHRDTGVIKRLATAILITFPCIILLLAILSSADSVFGSALENFLNSLFRFTIFNIIFKSIWGIAAGFYLFGIARQGFDGKTVAPPKTERKSGDVLILNFLLSAILVVYTVFVAVQIRYLFARGALPYGLSYTDYARRGFFELLFLSGVNILLMLVSINLSRHNPRFTRILCHYLCAVTMVLLASSFYRMLLYVFDDGLTRLRLLVLGFLVFEAAGLVITFWYIAKPKFSIVMVYTIIGLLYYTVLNIVPIDYIVAHEQVERYSNGLRADITYVCTLSPDAAPQIARVVNNPQAKYYFENLKEHYGGFVPRWQRWNLSVDRAMRLK